MRDQRWWTWHVLASLVILVFLGLHMVVMHLEAILPVFNIDPARHPIDWVNVVARAKSAFLMVTYIALLGAALFHGLYGLRNILFELNPAAELKKGISFVLVVGGLVLFVYGAWAAWAAFQFATTVQSAAAAAL